MRSDSNLLAAGTLATVQGALDEIRDKLGRGAAGAALTGWNVTKCGELRTTSRSEKPIEAE